MNDRPRDSGDQAVQPPTEQLRSAGLTTPGESDASALTQGPVLIIGTGLLGTSVGLALTALGVPVTLRDLRPLNAALARDLGAGILSDEADHGPRLVVVATPPDVAPDAIVDALQTYPDAVVTDLASVKEIISTEVQDRAGRSADRYVGSHPMAGRERSGAAGADRDLFVARPWVLVPTERSSARARAAVRNLAVDVGAIVVTLPAADHDQAVALVSHVPQLAASMVAARLTDAPENALVLAGQGLRDVTRIAWSDPGLWSSILVGNAAPIADVLRAIRTDLDSAISALELVARDGPMAQGAAGALAKLVESGGRGVARVPGKHGGAPRHYAHVNVLVPDKPGALARLFTDAGEAGINIEDVTMEHAAGKRLGVTTLSVAPASADALEDSLTERGWRVVAP